MDSGDSCVLEPRSEGRRRKEGRESCHRGHITIPGIPMSPLLGHKPDQNLLLFLSPNSTSRLPVIAGPGD